MGNWVIELLHEVADILGIDREDMMCAALKAACNITLTDETSGSEIKEVV